MKLLICAYVVAVTALSMTSAAVLPHRDYLKDILELQRTKGAVPVPQTEEYTRYMDLLNLGWYGEVMATSFASLQIVQLIDATEGFNPGVKDQIFNEYSNALSALLDILMQIAFNESDAIPMAEVALLFNERFAVGKEAVTTAERNIQNLIDTESPALSLRVKLLFAAHNAATMAAWAPEAAYLHQFLPSQ